MQQSIFKHLLSWWNPGHIQFFNGTGESLLGGLPEHDVGSSDLHLQKLPIALYVF